MKKVKSNTLHIMFADTAGWRRYRDKGEVAHDAHKKKWHVTCDMPCAHLVPCDTECCMSKVIILILF